jgi:hypothetical protein
MLSDEDALKGATDKVKKDLEKLGYESEKFDVTECHGLLALLFEEVWEEPVMAALELFKGYYEGKGPPSETDGVIFNIADPTDRDISNFNNAVRQAAIGIYGKSTEMAFEGYERIRTTSRLVNYFVEGIELERRNDIPLLSTVELLDEKNPEDEGGSEGPDQLASIKLKQLLILKHFTYYSQTSSARTRVSENRGHEIVTQLFKKFSGTGKEGAKLMPEDQYKKYEACSTRSSAQDELNPEQKRCICDFISGMTDDYAAEYYRRLYTDGAPSIFKPL